MNKEQILKEYENVAKQLEEMDLTESSEKYEELLNRTKELDTKLKMLEEREKVREKAKTLGESISKGEVKAVNIISERQNSENDLKIDIAKKLKKGASAEFSSSVLKTKSPVLTTTDGIVIPDHVSNTLNDTLQTRSMLVDHVRTIYLLGGNTFLQPYVKANTAEGEYTAEGTKYNESTADFGTVLLTRGKLTTMFVVSEEMEKIPAIDYVGYIQSQMVEKLKAKISREIINGTGGAQRITGIFHNPTVANDQIISPATDLSIATITDNTIDDILFAYGSENEDYYGNTTLLLNKKDLHKIYKMRVDGKKIFDVSVTSDTIDGVSYKISNVVKDLDSANAGEYIMAYGDLNNYLLAIFSDIEVQRSTDFKFDQGMICYKASIHVGGNVVVENGFTRVKKSTK